MAEQRQAIFPTISKNTSNLLRQTCQTQSCEPGVVVEAALLAFLAPATPTERDTLVLQGLARIHTTLEALVPLLKQIVSQLEGQAKPQSVKVASYGEMYAEYQEASEPDEEEEEEREPLAPEKPERHPGRWLARWRRSS